MMKVKITEQWGGVEMACKGNSEWGMSLFLTCKANEITCDLAA